MTKNVPNTQFFYTSEKHFTHTPLAIEPKEVMDECELMGNRLEECKAVFERIGGLLPLTEQLGDVLQDQILTGTLNMHQKGMIFMDTR